MDAHVGGSPFLVEGLSDELLPGLVASAVADEGNVEESVLKLRAAYSSTLANTSCGVVMVPAKRMWLVGGSISPSGTYATTGETGIPELLRVVLLYFTRIVFPEHSGDRSVVPHSGC